MAKKQAKKKKPATKPQTVANVGDSLEANQAFDAQAARRDRVQERRAKRWIQWKEKCTKAEAEFAYGVLFRQYESEAPVLDFLKWLIEYLVEEVGIIGIIIGMRSDGASIVETHSILFVDTEDSDFPLATAL